jgi:hypothetical protein
MADMVCGIVREFCKFEGDEYYVGDNASNQRVKTDIYIDTGIYRELIWMHIAHI